METKYIEKCINEFDEVRQELANAELHKLKAELAELRKDKARLDWLADKENKIGNVSLPAAIVERTLMLRDAIDLAMQMPN